MWVSLPFAAFPQCSSFAFSDFRRVNHGAGCVGFFSAFRPVAKLRPLPFISSRTAAFHRGAAAAIVGLSGSGTRRRQPAPRYSWWPSTPFHRHGFETKEMTRRWIGREEHLFSAATGGVISMVSNKTMQSIFRTAHRIRSVETLRMRTPQVQVLCMLIWAGDLYTLVAC